MNDLTNSYLAGPTALVGLSFVFLSGSLSGQELDGEIIRSSNGFATFYERQNGFDVDYVVDVVAPISIHAVAFSFVNDFFMESGGDDGPPRGGGLGEEGFGGPTGRAFFDDNAWSIAIITEDEWDGGRTNFMIGQTILLSGLGTFDSLFGEEDDTAIIFYDPFTDSPMNESNDVDEMDFEMSTPQFRRGYGQASTEGLFFDNTGAIVGSTVPEPSVSMLAVIAAFGLCKRQRR